MDRSNTLHFVGIGGAGMRSLARYAFDVGFTVTGSDRRESSALMALRALGATIYASHSADHVEGVDVVVVSSAVPSDNVELAAARAAGVTVLRRGEFLARLVADHPGGIAVCGTHGKGTTAGALVAMLEAGGEVVDFVLGADWRTSGESARHEAGARYLVAEVDESDRTHLAHRPRHLLVNNVEADHLDEYLSLAAISQSFVELGEHYARHPERGACVVGLHGEGVEALLSGLRRADVPTTTCAVALGADVRAEEVEVLEDGRVRATLWAGDQRLGEVKTGLKGLLNLRNIVSAAALAWRLGISPAAICRAASAYEGLVDRFHEAESGGRLIVTDYTSHPTSIGGNLADLRGRVTGRLIAVFQPFRYTLLAYHWDAYVRALGGAEHVHLAPLDAAGESPLDGVSAAALGAALEAGGTGVIVHPNLASIEATLAQCVVPGDALIVFGGGPLFHVARRLAQHFAPASPPGGDG